MVRLSLVPATLALLALAVAQNPAVASQDGIAARDQLSESLPSTEGFVPNKPHDLEARSPKKKGGSSGGSSRGGSSSGGSNSKPPKNDPAPTKTKDTTSPSSKPAVSSAGKSSAVLSISSGSSPSKASTTGSPVSESATKATGTNTRSKTGTRTGTVSSTASAAATGLSSRALCGAAGSACNKDSCPMPKKPLQARKIQRGELSGSLKARSSSLIARYDPNPRLDGYITVDLPRESHITWNAITRFPAEFDYNLDDPADPDWSPMESPGGKDSTGYIYEYSEVLLDLKEKAIKGVPKNAMAEIKAAKDKDGFSITNGKLTGCTSVYIVGDKGVFVGHYWENNSWDTKPHFKKQVIDALKNGRTVGKTRVHQNLRSSASLLGRPRVYIMHPNKSPAEKNVPLYKEKLDELIDTIDSIIPGGSPKVNFYTVADDGFRKTATTTIAGEKVSGVEKKNPNRRDRERGYIYYYKALKHENKQEDDGFTVFQYSKGQGKRIIQEGKMLYETDRS